MGKKLLDHTAHEGHLVVTRSLAQAIASANLTGAECRPVRSRAGKEPDPRFRWLRISSQWPRMARSSVVVVDDLCPRCGRTGYFDPAPSYGEWHYSRSPPAAADFNATWERFGYWRGKGWAPGARGVGGAAGIIVSDRARGVLDGLGVRLLDYVPLVIGGIEP
jgi:hypothetical protein